MSEEEATSGPRRRQHPCVFPWCTTPHGATLHESDEDHRSEGRAVTLVLRARSTGRRPRTEATLHRGEVEIGLLRRQTDTQTWLVIEDGRGIHVELSVQSAIDLLRALETDPAVAAELGLSARRS